MKKISSEMIRSAERKVLSNYSFDREDPGHFFDQLLHDLSQKDILTPLQALEAFFLALKILEIDTSLQRLKDKDKQFLRDSAERCLLFCQIQPISSAHSWLYSKLHLQLAEHKLQSGGHWESFIHTMISDHMGRDSREQRVLSPWLRALQSWKLGHIRIAQVTLAVYDHSVPDSLEEHWQGLRLQLRIQRLSGDQEQLQARFHLLRSVFKNHSDKKASLAFEQALIQMRCHGDPKALTDCLRTFKAEIDTFDSHLGYLWLFASRQKDPWKSMLAPHRLKSRSPSEHIGLKEQQGHRLLQLLELLYSNEVPMLQKFERIGKQLGDLHSLADPELGLVFLAGVIRWLYRSKQNQFATVLIDEYRALSLRYSDGQTEDGLGLIEEILNVIPVLQGHPEESQSEKLYVGRMPRILKISKLIAKSAYLTSKLKLSGKATLDERRLHHDQVFTEIFWEIEKAMGELKGPIMKIGQRLAISHRLTPNHREIMQRILQDAPPLPFHFIEKCIVEELGQPISAVFKEFDCTPIGVASIGEVFRARLLDGREVAVKVKYPDIESMIQTDFFLMKLLTPFYRNFLEPDELSRILKLVEIRFQSECDYLQEARYQMDMFQALAEDPEFIVPKVITEWTTKNLLVTEYIPGPRLDQFARTASADDRNRIAKKLLRFFIKSTNQHGLMHIDPHFGNFLVHEDRLVILDFGAVYRIPEHIQPAYQRMLHWRLQGNTEAFYEELVLLRNLNPQLLSLEAFQKYLGPILVTPFNEDCVRPFMLADQMNFHDYMQQHGTEKALVMDDDTFFPSVVSGFLPDIFHSLGAELNWHQTMKSIIDEISADIVPAYPKPGA